MTFAHSYFAAEYFPGRYFPPLEDAEQGVDLLPAGSAFYSRNLDEILKIGVEESPAVAEDDAVLAILLALL